MHAITGLGKYLFAIPMLIFGISHMTSASAMAQMAPFGGEAIVYFTGFALIAAAVSIIIGTLDKLATVLLAIYLLITALSIHLPSVLGDADAMAKQVAMSNLLKDIALTGGALMYARALAKDNSVIGG